MRLMKVCGAFRALARLEIRKLRSAPMRTLLTSLLIAIPIAAIVAVVNIFYIIGPTGEERAASWMGQADLLVQTDRSLETLRLEYPAGTEFEPISSGWEETIGFGRRLIIQSRRLNPGGLAKGMFTLVQGRMPNSPTEVAVSSSLLEHLQKRVGDQLSLSVGGEVEIVGEVENPESLKENAVFYQHVADSVGQYELLVKLPESGKLETGLPNQDVQYRRDDFIELDDGTITLVFLVGCLALFEAALVIAAAFIVGVRRRQRQIGLLASCGATPRQIFSSLLFSSFLTSLIAGAIGIVVGLLLARICYPWLDGWTERRNGPFEICWGLHFLTALLGIAVSIVSVTVPAIGACRMSIRKALSARSLLEKAGQRWLLLGVGSVIAGVLLVLAAQSMRSGEVHRDSDDSALWAILWGSILGIFGFGMCSPWLVACTSRLASSLPVSWRLAVREVGRYRARNATMVTAILAAMSLSIMSATLYQSATSAHQRIRFRMQRNQIAVVGPSSDEASQQIMKELGAVARAELRRLKFNDDFVLAGDFTKQDGFSPVAVGGVDLLKVIGVDTSDRELLEKFENGHVLILNGPKAAEVDLKTSIKRERVHTLPAASLSHPQMSLGNIRMVVSQDTMEKYELSSDGILWNLGHRVPFEHEQTWLIRLGHNIWSSERNWALEKVSEFVGTSVSTQSDFDDHPMDLWGMLIASLITGLVIVGIANALAGEEARLDQRILLTTGGTSPSDVPPSGCQIGNLDVDWLYIGHSRGAITCLRNHINQRRIELRFSLGGGFGGCICRTDRFLRRDVGRSLVDHWLFGPKPPRHDLAELKLSSCDIDR